MRDESLELVVREILFTIGHDLQICDDVVESVADTTMEALTRYSLNHWTALWNATAVHSRVVGKAIVRECFGDQPISATDVTGSELQAIAAPATELVAALCRYYNRHDPRGHIPRFHYLMDERLTQIVDDSLELLRFHASLQTADIQVAQQILAKPTDSSIPTTDMVMDADEDQDGYNHTTSQVLPRKPFQTGELLPTPVAVPHNHWMDGVPPEGNYSTFGNHSHSGYPSTLGEPPTPPDPGDCSPSSPTVAPSCVNEVKDPTTQRWHLLCTPVMDNSHSWAHHSPKWQQPPAFANPILVLSGSSCGNHHGHSGYSTGLGEPPTPPDPGNGKKFVSDPWFDTQDFPKGGKL